MSTPKEPAEPLTAVMHCTADNVREFNAALRQHLPGAHDLARELHRLGLITGLAGARIGPAGSLADPRAVQPVLPYDTERRLADAEWAKSNPPKHGAR